LFVITPVALLDIAASPARPRLDRLTRRLLEQCLLRLKMVASPTPTCDRARSLEPPAATRLANWRLE
jgi:hypothetical protein